MTVRVEALLEDGNPVDPQVPIALGETVELRFTLDEDEDNGEIKHSFRFRFSLSCAHSLYRSPPQTGRPPDSSVSILSHLLEMERQIMSVNSLWWWWLQFTTATSWRRSSRQTERATSSFPSSRTGQCLSDSPRNLCLTVSFAG